MQEMKELYQADNGEWKLFTHKIKCTDENQQEEKYTDDLNFYETYAQMHEGFALDEAIELSYTTEQLARLKEAQGIKYEHYDEVYDYVISGIVKADSKVFVVKNMKMLQDTVDTLIITSLGV